FGTSVLSPSGGPTAFRPPLYPLFLGAVYKVTGDSIVAARLVQAVLGAASVALVWFIARTLFGRRTAYVAAALAAVYPPLVLATVALMSESIFIPLMLVAVLAALYARDGGPHATRWAVVAGAAAGLGMLARPNSVAMLPALVVLVLAWTRHEWQRGVASRRRGPRRGRRRDRAVGDPQRRGAAHVRADQRHRRLQRRRCLQLGGRTLAVPDDVPVPPAERRHRARAPVRRPIARRGLPRREVAHGGHRLPARQPHRSGAGGGLEHVPHARADRPEPERAGRRGERLRAPHGRARHGVVLDHGRAG